MRKIAAVLVVTLAFVLLLAVPSWAAVDGVRRNILRFGEEVEVESDEVVNGDVTVFGADVLIAGTVNGNVTVLGGDAVLKSTAEVDGDFTVIGGRIEREAGARVTGNVTSGRRFFPQGRFWIGPSAWFGISLLSNFLMLIGMLALGAIVVALIPDHTEKIALYIAREPWHSIGWGFLLTLLVVPAIVLLAITIIGIPLIPVFLIFVVIAYIYGYIAACLLVGKRIFEVSKAASSSPLLEVIVGLLVVGLLRFTPFVGGLVGLVVGLLGFGSVLITKFGSGKPWLRKREPQVV